MSLATDNLIKALQKYTAQRSSKLEAKVDKLTKLVEELLAAKKGS